ncbi:hypothetical protein [Actinotalea subterranea]|uniref:hypothetical protein n=1 Tax=Actinotalea subterranea TaxID=2607497 RepID=UPI0011F084A2|nr:hypothetical protein [Actinotalea subterranea]
MSRVQWAWQFTDAEDEVLDRPLSPAFTNRFDAESWIGEQWRHLAEQGVAAAQLTQQGTPVGPPLPLRAA